jgi:hypothetical protein
VISQNKNDVSVKHLVMHTDAVLHVDRIKPFFGTREQAIKLASHDYHQFHIESINFFTGNPFVRLSMTFNITFSDGTITLPYGGDFIHSQQFGDYIEANPILYPLRHPAKDVMRLVRQMGKLVITDAQPGMDAFVDLRIYDGYTSTWFDSLNLPDPTRPYITPIQFTRWYRTNARPPKKTMIEAIVPFFGVKHHKFTIFLTSYDIMAYVHFDQPYWTTHLIQDSDRHKFPQILKS